MPNPPLTQGTFVKQEQQATPMALLTIHDVAQWLTVKPSTLYGWVAQGKMPALKILGVLRFRREDIEALLEACQIQQPNLSRRPIEPLRQGLTNVDVLIAEAKRAVYTASRGKPDQDRATRKGEPHGSV
jgi:excisionase family DNA binding protein